MQQTNAGTLRGVSSDQTDLAARDDRVPDQAFAVPTPTVEVRLLDGIAPAYAHPDDAGADLALAEDVHLEPGQRALARTGIAIALPAGYAGFVHPRSGLAQRHGVTLVNAPGTIDAGYRGEIRLNLINLDPAVPVTLRRGDRVAQLIVTPVSQAVFRTSETLSDTARGTGGHGSTGRSAPGTTAASTEGN